MKILFIIPSLSRHYGGIFDVVKGFALNLQSKNNVVEILSLREADSHRHLKDWKPLIPEICKVIFNTQIGYSPYLLSAINKKDADIGHINVIWSYTAYALYLWAKKRRKPYIISPNGMLDIWALKRSKWKKKFILFFFLKKIIENSACIHVNTLYEYECVRLLGFRNPICVISNGVILPNLNISNPISVVKDLNTKKKKLLFLSRIHPKKGLVNLLEAWFNLCNQSNIDESWKLIIVGFKFDNSDFENQIVGLVKKKKLANSVCLVESKFGDEMNDCYASSTAFVLPSFSEGVPMAALNAMAHSKPIIISKECNLPDAVNAGAAIEVESNIESICQGILKLSLLTDGELNSMGKRGRKLVESRYSWGAKADQMMGVYNWVVNGGDVPESIIRDEFIL